MRRNIVLALLFIVFQIQAQSWKLVWSDEFNTTGLPDSTKWMTETAAARNNELQHYTDRRIENIHVEKGNLFIVARKEAYQGAKYTSARLSTDGKINFRYGKIEARIKLPAGQGIWPAFWLLGQCIKQTGSPACGEIDIMEHVNNENKIHGTMHWNHNGLISQGGTADCQVQQFHIYAVEWDKNAIKWLLDGRMYQEINIRKNRNNTQAFHKPFYIILNLAIGGNWPGDPDSTTVFPDTMKVDYVRVYKRIRY